MLSAKIKEFITKYQQQNTPDAQVDQEYAIQVILQDGTIVAQLDRESHRWWDEVTYVKQFIYYGVAYYIGYRMALANRDESASELGYQFEPDAISFYTPYEKTITSYSEVDDDSVIF